MPLGMLPGMGAEGDTPPPSQSSPNLWLSPPSQEGSGCQVRGCLPSPGLMKGKESTRDLLCARGFTGIATCAQFLITQIM